MNTDYTSYNLRTYFTRQPGQPTHCPHCAGALAITPVEKSRCVREDLACDPPLTSHDYSLLFVCQGCGFWCLRESWIYWEIMGEYDYLVVGCQQLEGEPWKKALNDLEIYHRAEPLPGELAKIFPEI